MDEVPKSLRDLAYVTVGLAVIGFQRAQVRRRELARRMDTMDLDECLPKSVRDVLEVLRSQLGSAPPVQPES